MLKIILFLVVGIVIIAVAWMLAGIPGHIAASIGSYTIETTPPFAILTLVAFVIMTLVLLRIVRGVLAIPRTGAGWWQRHRHASGERAVTRVLVALAAGEQDSSRKEARRARTLLGDSPQTLLLVAEAARLSGREGEAEEAFRALTKQEDAK